MTEFRKNLSISLILKAVNMKESLHLVLAFIFDLISDDFDNRTIITTRMVILRHKEDATGAATLV